MKLKNLNGVDEIFTASIEEIDSYPDPERPTEFIRIKHGEYAQGFGGHSLSGRMKLWRREVLRAVLGEDVSINDNRITDYSKFRKALKGKNVLIFNGTTESDTYEILGIVGADVDLENAFFLNNENSPFRTSSDREEENRLKGINPNQSGYDY